MAKKEKKVKASSGQISFKDSIKTKLIGIMILVAAVPLIIAVIISYNTSTSKAKNDALNNLNVTGKYVETKFAETVMENLIALETFATAPSTINYIQTYGSPEQPIPTEVMLAHMDAINEKINDDNKSIILSITSVISSLELIEKILLIFLIEHISSRLYLLVNQQYQT